MIKRIGYLMTVLIIASVCFQAIVGASADESFSWYCAKSKDHKQPTADSSMRIVERYQGYYIDRKYGDNSAEKVVYLTFDAGYENGNVEKILNILQEEKVNGAFFILGNLIQMNPDLVNRMADDGHLICNHTFHHKDMTKIADINEFSKELFSLEELYHEATGKNMAKYYRPPEGKFDERSLKMASELGYKTVFWSLAYADWDNQNQPDPKKSKEKIMSRMHNGAVILLHPTSETNTRILKEVIQELKEQGFRFGSLDELTSPASFSR